MRLKSTGYMYSTIPVTSGKEPGNKSGEIVPIEKNKVVAFHYVLENEAGEEVENNIKEEPMRFTFMADTGT